MRHCLAGAINISCVSPRRRCRHFSHAPAKRLLDSPIESPSPMNEKLFNLGGKIALITGAFGGLGHDFARMLGEAGATLALAGRRIDEGRRFADEMAHAGMRAY